MTLEEFVQGARQGATLYIPGCTDKLTGIFDWRELNRLLATRAAWSSQTMRLIWQKEDLPATRFCHPADVNEPDLPARPDAARIRDWLHRGAMLVLEHVARLSPTLHHLACALDATFAATTTSRACCRTSGQDARAARLESRDLFVLQIHGKVCWDIYEGRLLHAIEGTREEVLGWIPDRRQDAAGRVIRSVNMCPGDLLYVPRGQFHDAMTVTDQPSLWIEFALKAFTGLDFMEILVRSLGADPSFRQALPHFDDEAAHRSHLLALGERLQRLLQQPTLSEQMRAHQRATALGSYPIELALPALDAATSYRVRGLGATLDRQPGQWMLRTRRGEEALSESEADILMWVLGRDFFDETDWAALGNRWAASELHSALRKASTAGLIEPIDG